MTKEVPSTAIADRAANLKQVDVLLLRALLQRLPPGQSVVRLLNAQLALAVKRTPRTVQCSLKRLVAAGLVIREAHTSQGKSKAIGTEVTWPLSYAAECQCSPIQVIESLGAAVTAATRRPKKSRAKRSLDATVSTGRFEYRHLRAAHRVSHLADAVPAALADCEAFVEFLARGFSRSATPVEIHLFGLRRKVTDGERGAPAPQLTTELVGTWGAPWRWASHLRRCLGDSKDVAEAMFRVEDDCHPLLLVDDVRAPALSRIPKGSAVVETSPGCYQVSAFAPRNLRPQERLFAQRALIALLGGDPAAKSSRQLRRMPGSVNNKNDIDCAYVARLVSVDNAPHFDEATLQKLLNEGWVLSMGGESDLRQTPEATHTPSALSGNCREGADTTQSGRDMRMVMRRLANGEAESVVRRSLERSAMQRGKSLSSATGSRGYVGATIAKAKKFLAERGALPRLAVRAAGQ
ncbi:MAG: hypothetical protein KBC73_18575 [Burkholderiaceae bacterium]|nr:hypothetical protein [Burkholderiaceae bacterium]